MRHLALRVRGRAIDVAVADRQRSPQTWIIPNRPPSLRRLVTLIGTGVELRACCEDGPHAYALFWQLAALGVPCDLVAPIGGPVDALVSAHRNELSFVWAPAAALAALGELISESNEVEDVDWESAAVFDRSGQPQRPTGRSGW
jgi:hypothetical protein